MSTHAICKVRIVRMVLYKLRDWIDEEKLDLVALLTRNHNNTVCEVKNGKLIFLPYAAIEPSPVAIPPLDENNEAWVAELTADYSLFDDFQRSMRCMRGWQFLSSNCLAISFLEKYPDKLCWFKFSMNSAIFVPDYNGMKESRKALNEEIIRAVWHPRRVAKWLELGVDFDEL